MTEKIPYSIQFGWARVLLASLGFFKIKHLRIVRHVGVSRGILGTCGFFFLFHSSIQAQLKIDVTGVGANQIPIAISTFMGDNGISQIVRDDLARSGLFKLIAANESLNEAAAPDTAQWQSRGADALVVGSMARNANGNIDVRFRLWDTVKRSQITALQYSASPNNLRLTAHRIADEIVEKLTGERGVFATRIAYITKTGGRYALQVADSDGQNAQNALQSNEPIISPTWSPDGGKLAYVSFEAQKPVVYVHNVATGARQTVANFKGSNSAPSFSPDGRRLAVVLAREGLSQLYLINADGSGLSRVTQSSSIDTEPVFALDGQSLYFTSDRSGGPQIYRVYLSGGEPRRVTFTGSYNISPRLSADGKTLAYISRQGGRFVLATLDLATGQERLLTEGAKDESPSFAPNGKMILFASEINRRGVLSAISVDGRVRQTLSVPAADAREPAWGPYFK